MVSSLPPVLSSRSGDGRHCQARGSCERAAGETAGALQLASRARDLACLALSNSIMDSDCRSRGGVLGCALWWLFMLTAWSTLPCFESRQEVKCTAHVKELSSRFEAGILWHSREPDSCYKQGVHFPSVLKTRTRCAWSIYGCAVRSAPPPPPPPQ